MAEESPHCASKHCVKALPVDRLCDYPHILEFGSDRPNDRSALLHILVH